MSKSISRRNILKSLTLGTIASSVLRVIPVEAAEYAHHMVAEEKSATPAGHYTPKFFPPNQFKTMQALCQTIIPADADSGGAIEAGAPEFIDLLTSENKDYQLALGGGLMWLDLTCSDRYGKTYLDCTAAQQKELLDKIAFAENAKTDPSISHGVEFFAFLRNLATDGFFTSKIGIDYLGFMGNKYLLEFPGCPPVPGL